MTSTQAPLPSRKWLWLLAWMVLLGTHPEWFDVRVRVLPSSTPALWVIGTTWQVPLARLPVAELIANCWFPLYAFIAAGVIAGVCRGSDSDCSLDRILATVGLSLLIQPLDLMCAVILGLPLFEKREKSSPWTGWLPVVGAGLAILTTLDFGIVLLAAWATLASASCGELRIQRRRWLAPLLLMLTACAVLIAFCPGFGSAAWRPVSAIWGRPQTHLLPSLSVFSAAPAHRLALSLLVPFVGLCARSALHSGFGRSRLLLCVTGLVLGLACPRYSCLAGLLFAAQFCQRPSAVVMLRHPRVIGVTCLVLALARIGWVTDFTALLAGQSVPRRLQPALWETSGPVILMNLDQSNDWRAPELAQRFPLLADDRWETMSDDYQEYAALCRDLRQVRDHSYLRSDGQWGGYKRWLDEWSPALVVVTSTDEESIRGLSLSPDWRVLGVDGERTMFGRSNDPHSLPQLRQSLRCLMTLEWPARPEGFTVENTIVTGSPSDDLSVGSSLCALRFPYAALRFIRHNHSAGAQRLRARCHLDLAHRVAGQSASGSVLDQYRAVIHTREILRHLPPDSEEAIRLERGLRGLDRYRLVDSPGMNPVEQQLRTALLTGQTEAVLPLLQQIGEPLQSYYHALADAPHRPVEEVCTALQTAITDMSDRASTDTRSEAHFYLGCAAIEAGESRLAIQALQASVTLAPNLPFREIRNLYLRQLVR